MPISHMTASTAPQPGGHLLGDHGGCWPSWPFHPDMEHGRAIEELQDSPPDKAQMYGAPILSPKALAFGL